MNDVTAVVLSIGEDYTARAIASVRRQTQPVADTLVVRGVSPFYRAINEGAARVMTPFFIQVDADMVLEESCVADLRRCMSERVGIVIGHLRDPLRGRILGVKLFRTRCFERIQFRDCVCQDLDFGDAILRVEGWRKVYALKRCGEVRGAWHSFGEHRPDYSPHYTFCKFRVEGARARTRKTDGKWRSLLQQLGSCGHEQTVTAVVGTARGLFLDAQQDLLVPYEPNEDADFLEGFLKEPERTGDRCRNDPCSVPTSLGAAFRRFYERGVVFRQQRRPRAFITMVRRLLDEHTLAAAVALVALCHGIFCEEYRASEAEAAFATFRDLLPEPSPYAIQPTPSCAVTAR